MLRTICSFLLAFAGLLALVLTGCNSSNSAVDTAALAQQRSRLLLSAEPDGAVAVFDVREALLGHGVADDEEDEGHTDPADHSGHDHGEHDHSEHVFPTEAQEVVMVGRIGGLANPWKETQPDFPFAKGRAMVFLADLGAVAEQEVDGHHHAPGEECAFCAAHAADTSTMLAFVRFLDENGEVLPMDVPQLFDVKGEETVVVRGSARIVSGGMLVLDATEIYVRR